LRNDACVARNPDLDFSFLKYENIKITTIGDLIVAEALMKAK